MATGRITRERYRRLVELLEQARQHMQAMKEIDHEVCEMFGIDLASDEPSHEEGAVTDAVWNCDEPDADRLLEEMEILVEEG